MSVLTQRPSQFGQAQFGPAAGYQFGGPPSYVASTTGIGMGWCNLICEQSTAALSVSVQVNWNGDGSTFVDESDHCLSMTISRGRSNLNDVFAAGTATVRLRNNDGRYSPNNSASALYPNVVGGRAVKLSVSYHGVSYQQFVGTIMEPDQAVVPAYSEMTIQCIDAFERFRLAIADADLQQNQRIDQIVSAILAANSWTGGTTLDTGTQLTYYAQPNTNVLQSLQDAAQNEVGGQVFMGKDGTLVFQSRKHRAYAPPTVVLSSNNVEKLDANARQSDLYGQVVATYAAYTWSAPAQSSYSGQGGFALYPGSNTLTDYYSSLAVQAVITPVASTDYTVIDQPSAPVFPTVGTGVQPYRAVDVSNNVSVQTFTTTGTSFTLTLYNRLPYTVYLQSLQIRATGVQSQTNPRLKKVLAPGVPLGANQSLSESFPWVQDDGAVQAWAMQRAATLSKQHPRPVLTLINKSAALTHLLLGADLSQRVIVNDTTGGQARLSGIQEQCFIENIALTVEPAGLVTAVWTLFDRYQGRY